MIAILIAALLQVADAPPPLCGSRDRDIGRGFQLNQYMFGGASEFRLTYRPPAGTIWTKGVTETAPFKLMFSQVDVEAPLTLPDSGSGPNVGYTSYQFTRADRVRLGVGRLTLRCGDGVTLSGNYSSEPPHPAMQVPTTIHAPFYNQAEYQCLQDMRRGGQFEFTVAGDDGEPLVKIKAPIELDWALSEVERLWRADLARAEQGQCRIVAAPPPPF